MQIAPPDATDATVALWRWPCRSFSFLIRFATAPLPGTLRNDKMYADECMRCDSHISSYRDLREARRYMYENVRRLARISMLSGHCRANGTMPSLQYVVAVFRHGGFRGGGGGDDVHARF